MIVVRQAKRTQQQLQKNTAFRLSIEQVDIHALFQNNVNQLIVDTRKGKRDKAKGKKISLCFF